MAKIFLKPLALLLAALSLGASYAHVLEAPPRLNDWPPELWREAADAHADQHIAHPYQRGIVQAPQFVNER